LFDEPARQCGWRRSRLCRNFIIYLDTLGDALRLFDSVSLSAEIPAPAMSPYG